MKVITQPEQVKYVEIGTSQPVTIDGYEWYVLARNMDKYLLMKKDRCEQGSSYRDENKWKDSPARNYLNGTFYRTLKTMKNTILDTTNECWNGTVSEQVTDKVFLCSHYDVSGLTNSESFKGSYTYGGFSIIDYAELSGILQNAVYTRDHVWIGGENTVGNGGATLQYLPMVWIQP